MCLVYLCRCHELILLCPRADAGSDGCIALVHAGALQLTRVGSRRVIQVGAVFAIVISVIGASSCCPA